MGGGFPPPPPTRPPPVLLPLLRLACAGDPGAARPGPRRPARRYSAPGPGLPSAVSVRTFPRTLLISGFTCVCLFLSPSQSPRHPLSYGTSQTVRQTALGTHAPSLSRRFPFSEDHTTHTLSCPSLPHVLAPAPAWHLLDLDSTPLVEACWSGRQREPSELHAG